MDSPTLNNPIDAIACPSCRARMLRLNLSGHLQDVVAIDLCFVCQGIWFDSYESSRIAPGGIIELFRLIHEHREDSRQPLNEPLRCPRCNERMLHSLDVGKSGKFNYYRCTQAHGRFTPFSQLMIEKGFVRQLSPLEITALAARITTIQCQCCGGPVDIRTDAACPHCRAPIAILDPEAVEQALVNYQHAELKRSVDRDPLIMADALLATERQRTRQNLAPPQEDFAANLIGMGIDAIWQLLRR